MTPDQSASLSGAMLSAKEIKFVRFESGGGYWLYLDGKLFCCCASAREIADISTLMVKQADQKYIEFKSRQLCDECGHPISAHHSAYGCEIEGGDGYRAGSDILEALGPCGCTAVTVEAA